MEQLLSCLHPKKMKSAWSIHFATVTLQWDKRNIVCVESKEVTKPKKVTAKGCDKVGKSSVALTMEKEGKHCENALLPIQGRVYAVPGTS